MKLHDDIKLFGETIRAASQHLNINVVYVEKDYWISLVLNHLGKSKYSSQTVFKGGTSLSKGFGLIDRFSEDVDIAIIDEDKKSGNEIRTLIRTVEKEMTKDLTELQMDGVTSKGSKFRKSVFEYPALDAKNKSNNLIVEINSFTNPFPFHPKLIKSMIFEFLTQTGNNEFVEQYDLQPFVLNVLNKEQTMLEKIVSLIRFSFEENVIDGLSNKIRHFYDLYFLMKDEECAAFIKSDKFKQQFIQILNHDKELFDEPKGWQTKSVVESPLITNFENIWKQLKDIYKTELSALAYKVIPDEKNVAESFKELIKLIQ